MSVLSEEKIEELSREMVKGEKSVNWLASKIEAAVLEAQKQEPVAEFVEDESAVGGAKFKLLKPLKVETKLYAAPVAQPDPVLCNFYQVDTFPDLVAAMEHHIEKLQAKVPPIGNNWSGKVREG